MSLDKEARNQWPSIEIQRLMTSEENQSPAMLFLEQKHLDYKDVEV